MKPLETPTLERIKKYVDDFDRGRYGVSERPALQRLFREHPSNEDFEMVLIKIAALNSLYSTFVRSIDLIPLAQRIVKLELDKKIRGNSALETIVDEIALSERHYFSFATKYCHFHNEEFYPIYDSIVEKLLKRYNKQNQFFEGKANLRKYPEFKKFIGAFRSYYGLNVAWGELDKFLWLYGKEVEAAKKN